MSDHIDTAPADDLPDKHLETRWSPVDHDEAVSHVGEGIHTGLRKAGVAPGSGDLWDAIDKHDQAWRDAVEFFVYGLESMGMAICERAEKAEADVERLTRERAELQDALGILVKRQNDDQSKIDRLTHERDEALRRAEIDRLQINRLTRERDKAERQHKALREDVEQERPGSGCSHIGIEGILRRDDERVKGERR